MDRASGVWTVRGVSEEARRAAKAGAAAAGTTLGAWVENAIAKQSGREAQSREVKKVMELGKSPKTLDKIHEADVVNDQVVIVPARGPARHMVEGEELKAGETVIVKPYDPLARENNPMLTAETKFEEAPPIRAHGRKRTVCQHGTEKGFNCWQCGGLAVIR